MPTMYEATAEVLLTSLAFFLDSLEKTTSKSHVEVVTAVLEDPCYDLNLLKTKMGEAGECLRIISKLIESFKKSSTDDIHYDCSFRTPWCS